MSRKPKQNRLRQSLLLFLILLMVTACGGRGNPASTSEKKAVGTGSGGEQSWEGEEGGTIAVADFQYVPLSSSLQASSVVDYTINGEWIYIATRQDESICISRKRILDGYQEDAYIIKDTQEEGQLLQMFLADMDGNCYVLWCPSPYGEREEEIPYSLAKYRTDGEPVWNADYRPEDLLGKADSLNQGVVTEDGRIFLYSFGVGGQVFAFGQDGCLEEVYTPGLERLEGVAAGDEGRVYGYCITGEEPVVMELGGTGETYTCPVRPLEVYSGYESGLLLRTWESMWKYEPETEGMERLWDWKGEYVQLEGDKINRFFCDGENCQMLFGE